MSRASATSLGLCFAREAGYSQRYNYFPLGKEIPGVYSMLETYFPIFVLMVLATGFVLHLLVLAMWLGPKRASAKKDDPFECGTISTGDVSGRHSVTFYLLAMTFIVFDVEIVFLYPWAVNLREFGWYGFWAVMPFFLILTVGLIYEWRRGVLNVR